MTSYTVGDLASMAGITVRTLHHYDEIGLLTASARTSSGYRLYDSSDVERLRTILTYRELGLSLTETARALDDDPDEALRTARDRVLLQIERLEHIARSLTTSLADNNTFGGHTMTAEDKLDVFGEFDPDTHSAEVEQRWGETDAYRESARRTNTYSAADWQRITAESDDIYGRLGELKDAGLAASSPEAQALVEEHRAHISRWYYECTPEIHAGLGQMYANDPRFTATIDASNEGLAAYLSEAIAVVSGDRS